MRYPIIAFVVVALVIVGFVLLFTNYNDTPTQKLNNVVSNNMIDECYDKTMDSWFIEFNKSQAEGATMSEADSKAAELALTDYEDCASGM